MNEDLDLECRIVAQEVVNSNDYQEAAQHVRGLVDRVASNMNQVAAKHTSVARQFDEWLAQHDEEMLSDPEIMKRVQAREQFLLKAFPRMPDVERWNRSVSDVRKSYGDATQRVIRGMRQQRFAARNMSDTESYTFETSVDDDQVEEAVEQEIAADRSTAIMQMRIANQGRRVEIDKDRYNEMELRRRQQNQR